MKRRRAIGVCVVGAVLLVVAISVAIHRQELRYGGIRLSDHLKAIGLVDSGAVLLRELDAEGIRLLGEYASSYGRSSQTRYASLYQLVPSVFKAYFFDPNLRATMPQRALMVLEGLGAKAEPTIPVLAALLADSGADPGLRQHAGRILVQLGRKAEPAAVSAGRVVADTNAATSIRAFAIKILAQIGPAASNAAPALLTGLGDPVASIRKDAAKALANAGCREALPILKKEIATEAHWLSVYFAEAIWKLDHSESNFVAAVLHDSLADERYHLKIAGLLWRVTQDAETCVPLLKAILKNDSLTEQHAKASALLATIEGKATVALPEL